MLPNYSSKVSKICCFISTISQKFNCEGIKNNTPTLKEQGIHAMTLSWARSRVWFISLLVPSVFTIPQMVTCGRIQARSLYMQNPWYKLDTTRKLYL